MPSFWPGPVSTTAGAAATAEARCSCRPCCSPQGFAGQVRHTQAGSTSWHARVLCCAGVCARACALGAGVFPAVAGRVVETFMLCRPACGVIGVVCAGCLLWCQQPPVLAWQPCLAASWTTSSASCSHSQHSTSSSSTMHPPGWVQQGSQQPKSSGQQQQQQQALTHPQRCLTRCCRHMLPPLAVLLQQRMAAGIGGLSSWVSCRSCPCCMHPCCSGYWAACVVRLGLRKCLHNR